MASRFEAAVQSWPSSADHFTPATPAGRRLLAAARIGWTVVTVAVVEALVCGLASLPVVCLWWYLARWAPAQTVPMLAAIAFAIVPSYVLFGLLLMPVSALAVRTVGWRTPAGLEVRIADVEWPLLRWVRGMVMAHIVRLVAGAVFRGSPVWTAYLRLAGARLGRRVYVNSLAVGDYNLLEFGDDVVIGDGVHLSGHTVEHGVLKTGGVRLGRNVTIGVGSIIEIDVVARDGCQVGAMSLVPKHMRLDAGAMYVGIPVQRFPRRSQLRPLSHKGHDTSVYELEDIMAPVTESAAKAASEYTEPVLAAIEESMRDVRRAVVAGRRAVEDCAAETTLQVRQHPFASLGFAAGLGALFGCMIGFTLGRLGGRPS